MDSLLRRIILSMIVVCSVSSYAKLSNIPHQIAAVIANSSCSFILTANSRKIHELEKNPKLLSKAHFLRKIHEVLPDEAFVSADTFMLNAVATTTKSRMEYSKKFDEDWAVDYGLDTPPVPNQYRWLYAHIQTGNGFIRIFNWRPETTWFTDERGQTYPSLYDSPTPKYDVNKYMAMVLAGKIIPQKLTHAQGDNGEILELVMEEYPIHKYLNGDGSLVDEIILKFKTDAALARGIID